MSWLDTSDPIRDALAYDSDAEEWMEKRPVCSLCGEHIQEETAFRYAGGWICETCIRDNTFYIDE